MSTLNAVPDDILHVILDGCDQREIVQLSSVNQRLHALAEPRLYGTVQSTWTHTKDPPIFLLLRSILARPLLARQIHKLILRSDPAVFVDGKNTGTKLDLSGRISLPADEAELDDVVDVVGFSGIREEEASPWAEQIRRGVLDAALAVLLLLLPGLVELSIDENYVRKTTSLTTMMRYALRTGGHIRETSIISKFESLQTIKFPNWPWAESRNGKAIQVNPQFIDLVLLCFHCPGIRHLTAVVEAPGTLLWPLDTSYCSTLTYLDISMVREMDLGTILSHCPRLETLSYHYYVDQDCGSPPPFLNCYTLQQSLTLVRNTLKSLRIAVTFQGTSFDCETQWLPFGMIGTIENLPTYPLLEKLEIPFIVLLGLQPTREKSLDELLPPNLRHLTLTDHCTEVEEGTWDEPGDLQLALTDWLDGTAWKTNTPRLEILELFFATEEYCYNGFEGQDLKQKFGLDVKLTGGARRKFVESECVYGSLLFPQPPVVSWRAPVSSHQRPFWKPEDDE